MQNYSYQGSSSNSYGNNGNNFSSPRTYGGGGGGYMPSSQGKSPARGDRKAEQPIRSVTIKQALAATKGDSEGFVLEGSPIKRVKIVGLITVVEAKSSQAIYTVDDGSGCIECFLSMADNEQSFIEQTYVSVFGQIMIRPEGVQIQTFAMRPVTDFNEITYHALDALKASLVLKKSTQQPGMSMSAMAQQQQQQSSSSSSGYGAALTPANSMAAKAGSLKDLVLDIHKKNLSSHGASVQETISALPQFSGDEVKKMILELSEEGALYETTDEDHHKCTD